MGQQHNTLIYIQSNSHNDSNTATHKIIMYHIVSPTVETFKTYPSHDCICIFIFFISFALVIVYCDAKIITYFELALDTLLFLEW